MSTTKSEEQFSTITVEIRELFGKKNADYGCSWVALRYSKAFTDQLYIKAKRIRTLQDTKENLVGDSIESEFIGLFNYSLMALISKQHRETFTIDTTAEQLMEWFDEQVTVIKNLRKKKNHDYGEAWRELRVSSIADLIMAKLLRIRQIENNDGKTQVSEPIEAGFTDIANYALFALVLIKEKVDPLK